MVDVENEPIKMVEQPQKQRNLSDSIEIVPKKSHKIVCNDEFYDIIEGEKITLPKKWETTLKTEGII